MGRKRKRSQFHKFKKLRLKTKKPLYSLLRREDTINPEIIMRAVWSRMGEGLDQRMLHDIYKIIDEFLLEKLIYEKSFTLSGFGSLELVEEKLGENNFKIKINFIPDSKLKDKFKLLKKEI